MCMATKTITITCDAYDALAREKKPDESFSQLALRLTSSRGTLRDCWGKWKLDAEEMKVFDEINKSWEDSDTELKKRLGSQ